MNSLILLAAVGVDQIFGYVCAALVVGSIVLYQYLLSRRAGQQSGPRTRRVASDGRAPRPGFENAAAPGPIDPTTGQYESYWVLPPEERAKGFVRPVRTEYWHRRCGTITGMTADIAETFARDPGFYGNTMCNHCRGHFPIGEQGEFFWVECDRVTRERVGT
jgi:hypothetical protein